MAPTPPGFACVGYHLVYAVLEPPRPPPDGVLPLGTGDPARGSVSEPPPLPTTDTARLREMLPADVEVIREGTGGERGAGDLVVYFHVVIDGESITHKVRDPDPARRPSPPVACAPSRHAGQSLPHPPRTNIPPPNRIGTPGDRAPRDRRRAERAERRRFRVRARSRTSPRPRVRPRPARRRRRRGPRLRSPRRPPPDRPVDRRRATPRRRTRQAKPRRVRVLVLGLRTTQRRRTRPGRHPRRRRSTPGRTRRPLPRRRSRQTNPEPGRERRW